MRTPKRIIALVMAIAMMSTCGVSTAFAAARADDTDTTPPPDQAYSITVAKNDNATVSVKVGGTEKTTATEGQTVVVTVSAKEGFLPKTVMIDGVDEKDVTRNDYTYTFAMPAANVTVTVTTEAVSPEQTYNINVTPNTGITVAVAVNGKAASAAKAGEKVTVTGTLANGYMLDRFNFDSPITYEPTGNSNEIIFTMPARDVKINSLLIKTTGIAHSITVKNPDGKVTSVLKVNDKEVPWSTKVTAGERVMVKTTTTAPGYVVETMVGNPSVEVYREEGYEQFQIFTMPDSDITFTVNAKKKAVEPDPIDPNDDVTVAVPDGGSAEKSDAAGTTEAKQIAAALNDKLAKVGFEPDPRVGAFDPIEIVLRDKDGKVITGTLAKPIDVSFTVTVPGDVKLTITNVRIMHNHNGTVEVITPKSVVSLGGGKYKITFATNKFSTFQPVVVKPKSTSGGGTGTGSDSYSGGSSGGGGSTTDREFDGTKMYLTGGEMVSAKTVEEIAGTDKVYTVVYRGQTYTFNGKNVAKPGKGVIYYTAEEFMKLVKGKLVTATGTVGNDTDNPDTGANDFVGLAMALGMVSLAGIAACGVAKKK